MAVNFSELERYLKRWFKPVFSDWWFPFQRKYVRTLFTCEQQTVVTKGPRQSFKSFCTALTASCFITDGLPVVLLAPTKQQSTDVICHHVSNMLEAYRLNKEREYPKAKQWRKSNFYRVDNVRSKLLYNGGRLLTVSGQPDATTDGLTAAMTVIDEAQDIDPETISLRVASFTDVYRRRAVSEGKPHLGKTVVLGRGGVRTSYIEQQAQRRDAKVIKVTADDVIKEFPLFGKTVEDARNRDPEHIFRANYYCDPLPSDACHIFAELKIEPHDVKHRPRIGIDWGRKDYTAGLALFTMPDGGWYIDSIFTVHGGRYFDMAARLAAWIDQYEWHPDDIVSELNSVGDVSVEILEKELNCRLCDHGIFLDADEKHQRIVELITRGETGRISVRDERIERTLLPLTYQYDDRSRLIKAVHSDELSALIMAVPAITGKVLELRRSRSA